MSNEICGHCKMPKPTHASTCLVVTRRRGTKARGAKSIKVNEIKGWQRSDADIDMLVKGALARRNLRKLEQLDDATLDELHDVIATLLEEAPTEDRPAWAQ